MLDIAQDQESTGAALGLPHPHWIHPDTEFGVWRADSPFFFYLCWFGLKLVDLARFGPIPAETGADTADFGQNGHRNRPIRPKWPPKQPPKWAAGRHSSASCGLVRRRKKKKKKKEEEDDQLWTSFLVEEQLLSFPLAFVLSIKLAIFTP